MLELTKNHLAFQGVPNYDLTSSVMWGKGCTVAEPKIRLHTGGPLHSGWQEKTPLGGVFGVPSGKLT